MNESSIHAHPRVSLAFLAPSMMDRIVSDKLRAFAPTALVSRRLTPRRVESKRMNA
jgi:hypothetical protein